MNYDDDDDDEMIISDAFKIIPIWDRLFLVHMIELEQWDFQKIPDFHLLDVKALKKYQL